ncbi:Vam6/Vps39-like protein [Quaeritorhiza haematococci]|nr:Vam6/Vps39-like protein [Quaeritorhiza haematococci]
MLLDFLDPKSTPQHLWDWSSSPEQVFFSSPYVIALLQQRVEVRSLKTHEVVQFMLLPQSRVMQFRGATGGGGGIVVMESAGNGLGAGDDDDLVQHLGSPATILVASPSAVWRLLPLDFEDQIESLIATFRFTEAAKLIEELEFPTEEDKMSNLLRVKGLHAHHVFTHERKYEQAISMLQELKASPLDVIALFPDLSVTGVHAGGPGSAMGLSMQGESTGFSGGSVNLGSDHTNGDTLQPPLSPLPLVEPSDRRALVALMHYLTDQRTLLNKLRQQHFQMQQEAFWARQQSQMQQQRQLQLQQRQDTRPVTTSKMEPPGDFPHAYAEKFVFEEDQETLYLSQVVDTTLLKVYLKVNEALVGPLLRVQNMCDVAECEQLLKELKKYEFLLDLYRGKGLHRQALSFLVSHIDALDIQISTATGQLGAEGEKRQPSNEMSESRNLGTIGKSEYAEKLHEDRSKFMDLLASYLKRLFATATTTEIALGATNESFDLVLEYCGTVLRDEPGRGIKIFTENEDEIDSHSRHRILVFLQQLATTKPPTSRPSDPKASLNHKAATNTPKTTVTLIDLPSIYLEFLIHELKDPTAEFHESLVLAYVDQVKAAREGSVSGSADQEQIRLRSVTPRAKLLTFLDRSTRYRADVVLPHFPRDDLWEERAILLSKLRRHEEALSIYIEKLNNFDMAEIYCEKHYHSDTESRNVFLTLLQLYLRLLAARTEIPQQPSTKAPRKLSATDAKQSNEEKYSKDLEDGDEADEEDEISLTRVLNFLTRYGPYIDGSKALRLLPPQTSLHHLLAYFERYLHDIHQNRNVNEVVKNLLVSERIQVQEHLIFYQSRRVVITEDRMCPRCLKRIANSVFACYPNGVVVHVYCAKN